MEDYSKASFVLSFFQFACEVGYPKMPLVDKGSQPVKGCETMKLSFIDIVKCLLILKFAQLDDTM